MVLLHCYIVVVPFCCCRDINTVATTTGGNCTAVFCTVHPDAVMPCHRASYVHYIHYMDTWILLPYVHIWMLFVAQLGTNLCLVHHTAGTNTPHLRPYLHSQFLIILIACWRHACRCYFLIWTIQTRLFARLPVPVPVWSADDVEGQDFPDDSVLRFVLSVRAIEVLYDPAHSIDYSYSLCMHTHLCMYDAAVPSTVMVRPWKAGNYPKNR